MHNRDAWPKRGVEELGKKHPAITGCGTHTPHGGLEVGEGGGHSVGLEPPDEGLAVSASAQKQCQQSP